MSEIGMLILECLERVKLQRDRRSADVRLRVHVAAVKRYQHQRFASSYRDLLDDPGSSDAARFFLDKLYGPRDFAERDEQFGRLVPALTRIFSGSIARTVLSLAELHALSEELDGAMAQQLATNEVDEKKYQRAWQQVGQAELRERQVELMLRVGGDLESYVKRRTMRASLRMMRGPASAAGFKDLQEFLEAGFDAFSALRNSKVFLQTIASRERAISLALFRN